MSRISEKIEESPNIRNAVNALRSFLPEQTIVDHSSSFNARAALAFKYEAQNSAGNGGARAIARTVLTRLIERHAPNPRTWLGYAAAEANNFDTSAPGHNETQSVLNLRSRMLAGPALTRIVEQPHEMSKWIWLDSAVTAVESDKPSPITAHDPTNDISLERGSLNAIFVHTDDVIGVEDAREQLRMAADYIAENPELRDTPLVIGATYEGMARLGTRMGMRQLEITDIDPEFAAHLRAAHTWTYFYNRKPREFAPAAVYLPTEEFIERFSKNKPSTVSSIEI